MDYRAALLCLAEEYSAATKRSEARIANLAGRDGAFFRRIRAGKTCNVDTLEIVTRWFSENWPDSLAWPDGIERPNPIPAFTSAEAAA